MLIRNNHARLKERREINRWEIQQCFRTIFTTGKLTGQFICALVQIKVHELDKRRVLAPNTHT